MRLRPAAAVFAWVAAQPRDALFTTSVNKAEILYGIAALPDGPHGSSPWAEGPRRAALAAAAEAMLTDDFAGWVLSFDEEAAVYHAGIVAARRREGRPIKAFDAQIVATARVADAELATREVGDFASCGLTLVNPWEAT
jgi:predicted nucleic acid-binding protein